MLLLYLKQPIKGPRLGKKCEGILTKPLILVLKVHSQFDIFGDAYVCLRILKFERKKERVVFRLIYFKSV